MKKFAAQLYKPFVSLCLVCCLTFLGFTSPAFADTSDPFMDGVKNGAGTLVVPGALCLGSALIFPWAAPAVCVAATETAFGWLGLKKLIGAK
jgi:hypothetical protein